MNEMVISVKLYGLVNIQMKILRIIDILANVKNGLIRSNESTCECLQQNLMND